MDKNIIRLADYINESDNIVFFGGAGVSTESGIPDFRSKDGLYNQHDIQFEKYQPEYLLSHDCLVDNPDVFFEFYRQKMDTRNIEPNIAHKVPAKLEKMGKLKAIVTQNIDGLHQKAGSENVYEIHGSTLRNYCSRCGRKYSSGFIFDFDGKIPICSDCRGIIRPDVVLYGEQLPDIAVKGAIKAIESADMLIIGGTSLTVYPAASFIYYFSGQHIAVINREPLNVKLNEASDVVINDYIGNVFKKLDIRMWDYKRRKLHERTIPQ